MVHLLHAVADVFKRPAHAEHETTLSALAMLVLALTLMASSLGPVQSVPAIGGSAPSAGLDHDRSAPDSGAILGFDVAFGPLAPSPAPIASLAPWPSPTLGASPAPRPTASPKPKVHPPKSVIVISHGGSGWHTDYDVSFYGPGFYGHRTACGLALTTSLVGVANRTLPCGTLVTFRNPANGRTVTAPVVDRGPYVWGRYWDLTGGLCKALRMCYTGTLEWHLH